MPHVRHSKNSPCVPCPVPALAPVADPHGPSPIHEINDPMQSGASFLVPSGKSVKIAFEAVSRSNPNELIVRTDGVWLHPGETGFKSPFLEVEKTTEIIGGLAYDRFQVRFPNNHSQPGVGNEAEKRIVVSCEGHKSVFIEPPVFVLPMPLPALPPILKNPPERSDADKSAAPEPPKIGATPKTIETLPPPRTKPEPLEIAPPPHTPNHGIIPSKVLDIDIPTGVPEVPITKGSKLEEHLNLFATERGGQIGKFEPVKDENNKNHSIVVEMISKDCFAVLVSDSPADAKPEAVPVRDIAIFYRKEGSWFAIGGVVGASNDFTTFDRLALTEEVRVEGRAERRFFHYLCNEKYFPKRKEEENRYNKLTPHREIY